MKNVLLTLACLLLFCGTSLAQPPHKKTNPPTKRPTPSKAPSDIAELIFKRVDSNHDGSISLKEFKAALPRLRQGSTRGSSQGRTRGFDGTLPGFRPQEVHPRGNSPSRGRPTRGSRGKRK